jgi:hypothetical protein
MLSKGGGHSGQQKIKQKNLSWETDRNLAESPSRDSFAIGFERTEQWTPFQLFHLFFMLQSSEQD